MIRSSDDTKSFCAVRGPASIRKKLIGSSDDTKSFCAVGGPASIGNKFIGSSSDSKSFCAVGGPASIRRVRSGLYFLRFYDVVQGYVGFYECSPQRPT